MPLSVIPVGPYDLRVPIGRGGMGEVWRAVHRHRGSPVAIKLMRPLAAGRPDLVACFHREVRAAAVLHHPNIAPVLDAGELPAEAEAASGGRFKAGSPFLVTELAFGSLAGAPPLSAWGEVRTIVAALLSALAHAHARGVTHRDLKPGNVLLAAPLVGATPGALPLDVGTLAGHEGARVLLADFGLAWTAKDGRVEADTASGTPAYMAPEQLDGRWRDIGPWTDMYGLGCLVWWLVAGRTPLQPRTFEQALLHQHRMLPALRPLFATPDGLESWLLRMVARDPSARFQTAADALWALGGLPEADGSTTGRGDAEPDPEITLPLRERDLRRSTSPDSVTIVLPLVRRAPPMAPSWRGLSPLRGRTPGLSDGLALFGIRPPPLIGREAQRDTLWSELAVVHADRRARAIVLSGLPGAGKSRLARWLCETADEAGAATPLRAGFGRGEEGFGELVRATLTSAGLAGEALNGRVDTWLMRHGLQDPLATRALARLAISGAAGLGDREVFEALRALISLVTRSRPVILWLDDAHLSLPALALVEHLLATGGTLPLLILLTARQGWGEDDVRAARLRGLLVAPLVRQLTVGPLPVGHHRELVRALAPLDPDLAARVEDRTRGNPGFAVDLLSAWVERGALKPGASGLNLAPGVEFVPDGLLSPWSAELERHLRDATASERDALVLAALFGQEVDTTAWESACAAADLPIPNALLRRFQSAGLIRQLAGHRPSFTFTHPLVREHLEQMAAREGRLAAFHRACAEVFLSGGGAGSAARLSRHLFAGVDANAAIAMLDRADGLALREAVPEGLALVSLRERALLEGHVPAADPRWGALWLARARLLLAAYAVEESWENALRAEEAGSRHGWRVIELAGRMLRGRSALLRGRLDLAEALLLDVLPDCGEPALLPVETEARVALAGVFVRRHDLDGATAELDRAEALLQPSGQAHDPVALLRHGMSYVRGIIALEGGRLDDARGLLREAQGAFRSLGNEGRFGEALCLAGLGTIARLEGLFARAERRLVHAITIAEIAGSAQALAQAVPLAIVALQRGDLWRARVTAGGALEHLQRLGLDADAALARLVLGLVAKEEGNQEVWEREHSAVQPFFELNRWRSVDLDWLMARAATSARQDRGQAAPPVETSALVAR